MSKQTKKTEAKDKRFKIGYGVKVPILSLEESINLLEEAGNSIGFEGALDDLSRKAGNTPTSSIFIKKLSTLKNYGLIVVSGGKFTFTELGQCIVNPTSPEQHAEAIFESLLKMDIPRAIYEKYKGKLLPERIFLGNFINKELDIPYALRIEWADYFIAAADCAGVLHRRESGSYQVMRRPWSQNPNQTEVAPQSIASPLQPDLVVQKEPENTGQSDLQGGIIETSQWGILNQRKVSGNRKAIFAIPDELTREDAEAIKKIIAGIEASLDGLLVPEDDANE